jgi:hypothetical protein
VIGHLLKEIAMEKYKRTRCAHTAVSVNSEWVYISNDIIDNNFIKKFII